MKYWFCLFAMSLQLSALFAKDVIDSATGAEFPREISFEANGKNYELEATGVATRKKLFVKVYSIVHYLQKNPTQVGQNKFDIILADENAKQLTMKWIRDVGSEKIIETFQEAFHKVLSPAEYSTSQGAIDQFLQFFGQGAKQGDQFDIRWLPGGYVEVLINGDKKGSVSDMSFAKGLWSVWLGPNSAVNREDLTNYIH